MKEKMAEKAPKGKDFCKHARGGGRRFFCKLLIRRSDLMPLCFDPRNNGYYKFCEDRIDPQEDKNKS